MVHRRRCTGWVRAARVMARSMRSLRESRSSSAAAAPAALAAAAAARARRPRRRAVHRRRALRHHARALPPGRHRRSPFPWHGAPADAGDARAGVRRAARLLRYAPARPAASRARSCSTKCSSCGRSRASPACATCCATCSTRWPHSPNRFVLTTRYVARAHRLLRDATARFEVMHAAAARGVGRHATCWRRPSTATSRCRPTIATTSAAPCRR